MDKLCLAGCSFIGPSLEARMLKSRLLSLHCSVACLTFKSIYNWEFLNVIKLPMDCVTIPEFGSSDEEYHRIVCRGRALQLWKEIGTICHSETGCVWNRNRSEVTGGHHLALWPSLSRLTDDAVHHVLRVLPTYRTSSRNGTKGRPVIVCQNFCNMKSLALCDEAPVPLCPPTSKSTDLLLKYAGFPICVELFCLRLNTIADFNVSLTSFQGSPEMLYNYHKHV